jgi:hypothetical protein
MALGFTQPLTEMSTRKSFWGKAQSACEADNLHLWFLQPFPAELKDKAYFAWNGTLKTQNQHMWSGEKSKFPSGTTISAAVRNKFK